MSLPLELLRVLGLALAAGGLVAAALCDLRHYEIPDRYALLLLFAFLATAWGGSWRDALSGLGLALFLFALGALLFARGWVGGGDVKLLAATGLWVSPHLIAPFALVTSLAGAALGLVMLTPLRRCLPAAPAALVGGTPRSLAQPMPFGIAIAAGGLFALAGRLPG